MSANVIITFTVKPERIDSFRNFLSSVKTDLPKVEGCQSVDVYNEKTNTNVFTLVELWNSEELHQKHISGVFESGNWDTISEHLEHAPVSNYFTKI